MKRFVYLCASLALILGLEFWSSHRASAQEPGEPVLEEYSISHGGNLGGTPEGFAADVSDRFFGNGTARVRIKLRIKEHASLLSVKVWRRVKRGQIVFALLVSRVEIRGYDFAGEFVYSLDLDGFVFGDSRSGKWSLNIEDLPAEIGRVTITFVGNYE